MTTRESAVADRAEAFWAQVDMTPTCWLWTGVTSAVNARKAECSKGHPFDDVNTYFRRGRRYCRTCKTTPVPCAECGGEFSPASLTRHIRRFHLVAS